MKRCGLSVDVEPDFPPYLNTSKGVQGLGFLTEIFRNRGINCTMFVTAQFLEKNPPIVQLLEGFEVGCHGYRHVDYTLVSLEEFESDLLKALDVLKNFGFDAKGFRAPYCKVNDGILEVVGRHLTYDSSLTFTSRLPEVVKEVPVYTGGKVFGVYPRLFQLLLGSPFVDDKVFFIHPWEYGGVRFEELIGRRRNMKYLGYRPGNYVRNLLSLLDEVPVPLKNLL